MINNIPVSLLSRIGTYEVDIHSKVKASVVDNSAVVVAKIDELNSSLQTLKNRVVGIDIKFVKSTPGSSKDFAYLCWYSLLDHPITQLCIFPEKLVQFLSDETICFLGTGISHIVSE
jgi:hypothetical protein